MPSSLSRRAVFSGFQTRRAKIDPLDVSELRVAGKAVESTVAHHRAAHGIALAILCKRAYAADPRISVKSIFGCCGAKSGR
jgi:hypothetical protein